jgi:predicted DNA binding CopG/RHH family protein
MSNSSDNSERDKLLSEFDASKEFVVEPRLSSTKLVSIRLSRTMITTLKEVAAETGCLGYQTLLKSYIADGLRRYISNAASPRVVEPVRSPMMPKTSGGLTWSLWESKDFSIVKDENTGQEPQPPTSQIIAPLRGD